MALNYKIIEKIVANEQLDTLNLGMCTGLTFECCQLLITNLSLLRCLNIAWTDLTSESVQYICENIPRGLEQLNISGQRYNLTDDYLQSLVRRALRLRILDISDSVLITDQSIISLRQHSRLLAHLSASRCYLLTSPTLITLKLLPAFSTLDVFGTLPQLPLQQLRNECHARIHLNMFPFSNIARPTTGIQRTSIWGLRTRL
jgi:F-box and leucine-rich repeat protein 1 (S-phase kinase-associated protein 2)